MTWDGEVDNWVTCAWCSHWFLVAWHPPDSTWLCRKCKPIVERRRRS